MMNLHFIWQFMRHPTQVGTFTQSSKTLAKKMAEQIDGSTDVVELGAGTGPVTTEILKCLPENGRLTCFEINPKFCRDLERINDARLKVINDDAGNCQRYVDSLDCVVSGLPLVWFTESKQQEILAIASKSRKYIQLQYTPLLGKKMRNYFSQVKIKFVPQNLPPAFIYVCKNPAK